MRRLIDMSKSRGLGDSLTALQFVKSLETKYPDDEIIMRVVEDNVPWMQLFHREVIARRHIDYDIKYTPYESYDGELRTKSEKSRHQYYSEACDNVPPTFLMPTDKLQVQPAYSDAIVLAPFSTQKGRSWLTVNWLVLEDMLIQAGRHVIICDRELERCKNFQSWKCVCKPPKHVAELLFSCQCLIGVDSALPHLASMLGTRAVVLCGPTDGEKIFPYPTCTVLKGSLPCTGCYWSGKYFQSECLTVCASMNTVSPEMVFNEINKKPH